MEHTHIIIELNDEYVCRDCPQKFELTPVIINKPVLPKGWS